MNVKLNMKDINKILAQAHYKCKFLINDTKTTHFAETCIYEAVGSILVIPSPPLSQPSTIIDKTLELVQAIDQ